MTLAIHGGEPVRNSLLPYGRQWLDEDEIAAVVDTLKSPYITQGPKITEFESRVAEYVGAKHGIAFANGTAALHGACYAAGLGEGDEVITTPVTFAASANCALYMGASPVFVDIDNDTYNIDPQFVEKAITPKTKAIIPVDFTGQPVDAAPILEIAETHNLIVIEDAAHAIGASYKGRNVGSLSDMTMFSFHPVKHITTGEGGMIVTDSDEFAEKLRLFRAHGITKEHLSRDEGPWFYEMNDLGYNYRITDIQAALGLSQLAKLDQFVERRRQWVYFYNKAFSEMPEVTIPHQLPDTESSWHLYVLRLNLEYLSGGRREIFEALRAENIGVQVHYIPVHLHPYYHRLGYRKGLCPVAEDWYEEVISLPLFPKMTEADVDSVIAGVRKVLKHYRK
ncbi:MAG TPA: UDP-4-amino-4,6-dideoxy-N-acetyl-beta-L-altrosamine transaminase [Bacillales bacterium]